jgi:hypothetical protein
MNKKTPGEWKSSLSLPDPPAGLSEKALALWYAGKGDWERAHQIVQDMEDTASAQIHAYLHRREGDLSNARYWYTRAGTRMPLVGLDEEWEELVARYGI